MNCFLLIQIDDVIEEIISLESSFNDDIITLIDSGLQLPSTVRKAAQPFSHKGNTSLPLPLFFLSFI